MSVISDNRDLTTIWVERLETWLPRGKDENKQLLQDYATSFIEQDIDTVERLALLTNNDLASLGVAVGHRPIILQAAREASRDFDPPTTWELICGRFGLDTDGTARPIAPGQPPIHGCCANLIAEFRSWNLWRAVFAEFFASGIYMFLVTAVIISSGLLELAAPNGPNSSAINTLDPYPTGRISVARYLSIAIGSGFAFALTNFAFWPASGGHITPAITFALLWTRQITFLRWILYLIAQVIGAIIGAGFLKAVNQGYFNAGYGGVNRVHYDLGYDDGVSVGLDALTTFILCLVALSFYDRRRIRGDSWFGHLALGLVFLVVALVTIPILGISMNPARSFASAALYHRWGSQWTWWLGPFLGAVIAAIWYELFIRDKDVATWRAYH